MTVTVSAAGAVCPFGDSFCTGPDGYTPWDTTRSAFGGFRLPGAPAWGLVGRVGSRPWTRTAMPTARATDDPTPNGNGTGEGLSQR
jgi:hypothetical protein